MSETIWVDTEGRSKSDLPNDNSIMLALRDELDRLSDKLEVAKLSQFYDYSELEAQYADEEAADDRQSGGTWFDPAPALAACRSIREHLAQYPEELALVLNPRRRHWPASLTKELQDCESTLESAATNNRKFRFLIVP